MKITLGSSEKTPSLKAVVCGNEFWVRNDSGGVTWIMENGTTVHSIFPSLEAVARDHNNSVTLIYEGDTITITF